MTSMPISLFFTIILILHIVHLTQREMKRNRRSCDDIRWWLNSVLFIYPDQEEREGRAGSG